MRKSSKKLSKNKKMRKTRNSVVLIRKKQSRKNVSFSLENSQKSHIVKIFLEMLHMIKLYHWRTKCFSEHKATDELHGKLSEHIDKFVEVLLGKDQSRVKMLETRIDLLDIDNTRDLKERIFEYRDFLTDMNIYFDEKRDSDLLNIRDEIVADLNQFLYLLTLE
jgi:hypothetical protein